MDFAVFNTAQPIADLLTALVNDSRPPRLNPTLRRVYKLLAHFRTTPWQPALLTAAAQFAPLTFTLTDSPLPMFGEGLGVGFRLSCDPLPNTDPLTATLALLDLYLKAAAPPLELYTIAEAAAYLNLAPSTVKKHLYQTHYLEGFKKFNHRFFVRAELDAFQALQLRPGPRPRL